MEKWFTEGERELKELTQTELSQIILIDTSCRNTSDCCHYRLIDPAKK